MTPMLRPRHTAIWSFAQRMNGRAADKDLARGGPVDAGDHVDQRGFAAARFADDGDKFAAINFQIDILQGGEIPGGAAISLHHIA